MLFAAASVASNLKDVRVGPHGEYTRVVLETDGKASYSLNQTDGVVTIELQASAMPKAVTAKSQQLSWVRVEPIGASTLVKIELKGPARVKQMVLTSPHRIVLDVFADASAASRPASAPVAPEPVAVSSATTEPRFTDEDALVGKEATDLLGPDPAALPGDEIAATEGAPEEFAEPSADSAEAGGAEPVDPLASAPAPDAKPATTKAAKRDQGLLDWIQNPYILGILAIVMLGLVVILRRQRPAAPVEVAEAHEESSAASLFEPAPEASTEFAEEPAVAASTGAFDFDTGVEADAADGTADDAPRREIASPFEFAPSSVPEPEKPDLGRAHGAMLSTIGAVTSTAAYETQSPTATGGLSMAELDRRLALLEQRLEEVIDAKDRLERQVSAQTEELRVQRAAIARTQRVVRTIAKTEDMATEPVPRANA